MKNITISIIKFLCPLLVIFVHTIALTKKTGIITEICGLISKHFVGVGIFAVSMIFLISGYLFERSLSRNTNDKIFWKKKLIRLMTPLSITIILSIIVGCLISSYSVAHYFSSKDTYEYLFNIIFIPKYKLPGVFVNNPYPNVVKGSLWTMPLTILCYMSCFVIYKIKFLKKNFIFITLLLLIFLMIGFYTNSHFLKSSFYPATSFYTRICFNKYRDKIKYDFRFLIFCIVILIIFSIFKITNYCFYIVFPYIVFFVINKTENLTNKIRDDYSYEIYLCAFPIQQMLVYCSNNGMSQIVHFGVSIIISIAIGILIKKCSMLIINRINNEGLCNRC